MDSNEEHPNNSINEPASVHNVTHRMKNYFYCSGRKTNLLARGSVKDEIELRDIQISDKIGKIHSQGNIIQNYHYYRVR